MTAVLCSVGAYSPLKVDRRGGYPIVISPVRASEVPKPKTSYGCRAGLARLESDLVASDAAVPGLRDRQLGVYPCDPQAR